MVVKTPEKPKQLREITKDGRLVLNFHKGQTRVWESTARFVFFLAGTQVGKTSFCPHWLYREIQEQGEGDYLVVTATYPLLNLKLLPEFLEVFVNILGLGHFNASDKVLYFSDSKTRIIFGSATNPESIESATAKAAVLDECGQMQFKRDAWEAVQRRLSLAQGRVLGTTTLYGSGWLKNEVYDRWMAGDPNYDIIQVDSTANPSFPKAEYERAMANLPKWKFNLFYRGRFDKPAGLIYDAFDENTALVNRFDIPREWNRFVGMDFGMNNTAGMFYALEPTTGNLYAYREYLKGGKSAAEHSADLIEMSKDESIVKIVGGAQGEEGWREAFGNAGWHVLKPAIKDVEVGINKVYAFHKRHKLFVFRDLLGYLDEKQTYSRELDEKYQPTDKIADKERFHYMDAERYILSEFDADESLYSKEVQVRRFYG